MQLNPAFDLILGQDWCLQFRAKLHYDDLTPFEDKRGVRFVNPKTAAHHTVPISVHFNALMNSCIGNTVADVQAKFLAGETEYTRIFMIEVSPFGVAPVMSAAAVAERDISCYNTLPHHMQPDFDERVQFNAPGESVQVATEELRREVESSGRRIQGQIPTRHPSRLAT